MRMKELVTEVKRAKGLTNYGLARDLRRDGVEITSGAIDGYMKGVTKVRLDVLCGLVKMLGRGWEYAGKLIEKGTKMKKLALIFMVGASLVAKDARAQFPECPDNISASLCSAIIDCKAALGDFDPICLGLSVQSAAAAECFDNLASSQSEAFELDQEVVKLRKRIKRLRNKVAELQK